MYEFVAWLFGTLIGAFCMLVIMLDHPEPELIGKDRGELLKMKAGCEKTLTRQESCKAVITFVPEAKAP